VTSEPAPENKPDPLQVLGVDVVIEGTRILWETSRPVPDRLWHYTDAAGALGVVRGRELWATHALFMNDASELRLAYPLLEDALEVAGGRTADNELLDLITVALGAMVSRRPEDPDVYAVCFCEDGDLLSQWRAYGVFGGGYAVGFDGPMMEADSISTYGFNLSRVIYDADGQRQLAQELVDRTIGALVRHLKGHPGDFDKAVPVVARNFSHLAQAIAYQIKDEAFREEHEWRLIYARDVKSPIEAAARRFRSGARGLVPYVSIPMGVPAEGPAPVRLDVALAGLPVREVRVGPTAHPEIAALAMRYLLGPLSAKVR
jgi:hypothetical protein